MALKNLRFWCAKPETALIGLQTHATPSELKKRNPPAVRETMAGESYCLETSAREEVKLFRCSIRRELRNTVSSGPFANIFGSLRSGKPQVQLPNQSSFCNNSQPMFDSTLRIYVRRQDTYSSSGVQAEHRRCEWNPGGNRV